MARAAILDSTTNTVVFLLDRTTTLTNAQMIALAAEKGWTRANVSAVQVPDHITAGWRKVGTNGWDYPVEFYTQ